MQPIKVGLAMQS